MGRRQQPQLASSPPTCCHLWDAQVREFYRELKELPAEEVVYPAE